MFPLSLIGKKICEWKKIARKIFWIFFCTLAKIRKKNFSSYKYFKLIFVWWRRFYCLAYTHYKHYWVGLLQEILTIVLPEILFEIHSEIYEKIPRICRNSQRNSFKNLPAIHSNISDRDCFKHSSRDFIRNPIRTETSRSFT